MRKVDPEYSPTARDDGIQGTVILQLVVDEKGFPTDITVVSPLGFGLDEQALAAVEKWRFVPGTKDGKPVKILATIEVNFRFPGIWFDEKTERRRTSFNVSLRDLKRADASQAAIDRAVKTMGDLSHQKFPAAMFVVGTWEINGEHGAKDPEAGLRLIQNAADKNYGPALADIARRRIDGRGLPQDVQKGLEEMRQAATMGSLQAQFDLGSRYEMGAGVPRELDRARRYFRLCATRGVAMCQYKLANLLFNNPDRRERDYIQAIALFELAAENGVQDAKEIVSKEASKLTSEQINWVKSIKSQLVRK